MVRTLETKHPCPCSVEEFWGLREDPEWDRYNAELDGQLFTTLSKDEALDPTNGAVKVNRTHQLKAIKNPIPKALRGMLGSDEFKVVVVASWYKLRYTLEEAMTLTVRPPVFATKISISGKQWAERIDDNNCMLCTSMSISCKIPAGVGGQVEKGTEKGMKTAYADQPRRVMDFLKERKASGKAFPDPFADAAVQKAMAVEAAEASASVVEQQQQQQPRPPAAAVSAALPFSSPLASAQVLVQADGAAAQAATPPTGGVPGAPPLGLDEGGRVLPPAALGLAGGGSSGSLEVPTPTYDVTSAGGSSLLLLRQTIGQQRAALQSAEAELEALVRSEERRLTAALHRANEQIAALQREAAAERARATRLQSELQNQASRTREVGELLALAVHRLEGAGLSDEKLREAAAPFAGGNGSNGGKGHAAGAYGGNGAAPPAPAPAPAGAASAARLDRAARYGAGGAAGAASGRMSTARHSSMPKEKERLTLMGDVFDEEGEEEDEEEEEEGGMVVGLEGGGGDQAADLPSGGSEPSASTGGGSFSRGRPPLDKKGSASSTSTSTSVGAVGAGGQARPEELLLNVLHSLESGAFAGEAILSHVGLGGCFLLTTNRRIVYVRRDSTKTAWELLWNVEYADIVSAERSPSGHPEVLLRLAADPADWENRSTAPVFAIDCMASAAVPLVLETVQKAIEVEQPPPPMSPVDAAAAAAVARAS